MSLSNAFNNLLAKTPLSATFGQKVSLPEAVDEPLMKGDSSVASEKCELRIEGMTCGACVEVSLNRLLVRFPTSRTFSWLRV